jgi:hypothetical protein
MKFFVSTPLLPLSSDETFRGVGVYALYYLGSHPLYEALGKRNKLKCVQPIYVGKAVPAGWRTARTNEGDSASELFRRISEHARSLHQVEGLPASDFRYRFVIMEGIEADLIGSLEASMIRKYMPVWNTVIDGFGNHDPGKGRYNQAKSEWDALHPGRPWAERLTGATPSLERIKKELTAAMRRYRLRKKTTAS